MRYPQPLPLGAGLLLLVLSASMESTCAQGYGDVRPWGRLPYNPGAQQQSEQPKRYNPWAQMREAERLPPPEYRGEADENAPTYHEPDPTYRERSTRHERLADPRAYASPWSESYSGSVSGGTFRPYYPGMVAPWRPGATPYPGAAWPAPYYPPWGGGPWPW